MFKKYKIGLIIAVLSLSLLPLSVHGYIVQRGDTLSELAYKFGTTISELVIMNNIKNPNLIYTGQYLDTSSQGGLLGANPLPEDNYDTYLTSPVSAADTTIFVNRIPSGITESIYTLFATDGRTVREKIYCTGATSTPNRLTGCVRGLSFYPTASGTITETGGTGLSHSKNARIAITDNINFSGKALAYLYGNQILPGNLLFNNGAIIGLATPTSSATSSAANVDYVNRVAIAGAPDSSQTIKGIVEVATDSELAIGKADGTGDTSAPLVAHAASFNVTSTVGNKIPVGRLSDGKLDASWGGATSSLATLNSSSTVVQNPASATSTPTANSIPISDSDGKTYGWMDGIQIFNYVAGESIDATMSPIAVYEKESDKRVYKLDTTSSTEAAFNFLGFVPLGQNVTMGANVRVQIDGLVKGFPSLTEMAYYYGTNTAGQISTTPGTKVIQLGRARNVFDLLIIKGKKITSGQTSFNSTASTTITLGYKPSRIIVHAYAASNKVFSNGGWNYNSGNGCVNMNDSGAGGTCGAAAWTISSGATSQVGTIIAITSTGFTLNNVKTGAAPDVYLFWEAEE